MLALLLSPIGRWVGGAGLLLAACAGLYWLGHAAGARQAEREALQHRIDTSETIRRIERNVRDETDDGLAGALSRGR